MYYRAVAEPRGVQVTPHFWAVSPRCLPILNDYINGQREKIPHAINLNRDIIPSCKNLGNVQSQTLPREFPYTPNWLTCHQQRSWEVLLCFK